MQTTFAFTESGIAAAIDTANAMACVKATIVPDPELVGEPVEDLR